MAKSLDQIIDNIRKLYAMANHPGSNEHEAANAAKMAERLLRKHNLSISDITPEEAKSQVTESTMTKYKWTPGRAPVWAQTLSVSIAELHDCFVIWTRAAGNDEWVKKPQMNLCFVGLKADVLSAELMFDYLYTRTIALSDSWYKDTMGGCAPNPRVIKNSYRSGMVSRFRQRFAEMKAEQKAEYEATGTALVVVKSDAIKEYLDRDDLEYGSSSRQESQSERARAAGYTEGGNVSFNKQMGQDWTSREKLQ